MGELIPKEDVADEVAKAERRGYEKAQEQALDLLDKETEKSKSNGDFQTAEVFELIRAKLKAHGEKKA